MELKKYGPLVSKIRVWLNTNKILSITAIIISLMAIIVSMHANQIASDQTIIMKSELLPILHLNIDQKWNFTAPKYSEDEITIYNIGAPLSEFKFKNAIFFKVKWDTQNDEPKEALVPIDDYYYIKEITDNPQGELITFYYIGPSGHRGNYYKAANIIWTFSDFADENNANGSVDLLRYFKLSYKDIFGDNHIEYYQVDRLKSYRLSEIEGQKIFKHHGDNRFTNSVDFDSEISPDLLYEKMSSIVNESKEKQSSLFS